MKDLGLICVLITCVLLILNGFWLRYCRTRYREVLLNFSTNDLATDGFCLILILAMMCIPGINLFVGLAINLVIFVEGLSNR